MSADATDDASSHPTTGPDASDYTRYDVVVLDGDEFIVYDVDDEHGWIQSSVCVDLEEMR